MRFFLFTALLNEGCNPSYFTLDQMEKLLLSKLSQAQRKKKSPFHYHHHHNSPKNQLKKKKKKKKTENYSVS